MKRNKLIVVSADAMVDADLELMETLPNYQAIFGGRASMVKRVRTIYPTVTYPAHASMRTGVYPARHGIISKCTGRETGEFFLQSILRTSGKNDCFYAEFCGGKAPFQDPADRPDLA